MGAWFVGFNLSFFCLGFDIFLHYGSLEIFLCVVLLFEPVLSGSSSVRKPR